MRVWLMVEDGMSRKQDIDEGTSAPFITFRGLNPMPDNLPRTILYPLYIMQ